MIKTRSLFLLFAIFSLFFAGCGEKRNQAAKIDTSIIRLKPIDSNETIVLQKTNGGLVMKNEAKKLLILDIFATWCPPCRAEAKVLGDIQKKFPNQVRIIGVTVEEEIENAKLREFIRQNDAAYTFVNSPQNRAVIDTVKNNLKIEKNFAIPLVVLYKDGKVFQYYIGATEEEFIISDIKQAVGK